MTAIPAIYLRKSSDEKSSKQAQRDAVMEIARRDGYEGEPAVYDDWARSGDRAKLAKRTAWRDLNDAIERDEISTVYVRVLDRTGRSLEEWLRFLRVCQEHAVRIVDQTGERTDPDREDSATMEMWAADRELKRAKERAAYRMRMQRARGDALGRPPYGSQPLDRPKDSQGHGIGQVRHVPNPAEDVGAVLDAYDRAGSFLGAAKLLTAEGNVLPRHGTHWSEQTVQRIVRRHRYVGKTSQGVKQKAAWALFRLLKCPVDGTILTAQKRDHPVYFCNVGRRDPRHPRPYSVAESKVIDWVREEASRLRVPGNIIRVREHNEMRRAELEAQRERLGLDVVRGLLGVDKVVEMTKTIDAELAALDDEERLVEVPQRIDWTGWSPAAINEVLRAMWEYIELDEAMQPRAAGWLVPGWRAD